MTESERDKRSAAYRKVVAQAWRDPAFKAKLMADPGSALKEAGFPVPPGVTVTLVENTEKHFHLVLPTPAGALPDEALERIVGGSEYYETVIYPPSKDWDKARG